MNKTRKILVLTTAVATCATLSAGIGLYAAYMNKQLDQNNQISVGNVNMQLSGYGSQDIVFDTQTQIYGGQFLPEDYSQALLAAENGTVADTKIVISRTESNAVFYGLSLDIGDYQEMQAVQDYVYVTCYALDGNTGSVTGWYHTKLSELGYLEGMLGNSSVTYHMFVSCENAAMYDSNITFDICLTSSEKPVSIGDGVTFANGTSNLVTTPNVEAGDECEAEVWYVGNGSWQLKQGEKVVYQGNGTTGGWTKITLSGVQFADSEASLTFVAQDGEKLYLKNLRNIADRGILVNGGFEDGMSGWEGYTGTISNADTYWEANHPMNNDGFYYAGVDAGTETLTSSTFVVGKSGWITFKLGSMRPNDGTQLRDVYVEVVEAGTDNVLARVRNILWSDPAAALRLNDYKLDLSAYDGKEVYIRAVDNEDGDNFRSLYLDAFVTSYDEKPAGEYTDLTGAKFLSYEKTVDLNDGNEITLEAIRVSEGLLSTSYNCVLTSDSPYVSVDGMKVTANKSGTYKVVGMVNGENAFEVTLNVVNTTALPTLGTVEKTFESKEWSTGAPLEIDLPAVQDDRFTWVYSTDEEGAVIQGNTLSYTPDSEGVKEIKVQATFTDKTYPKEVYAPVELTVKVTLKGDDIVIGAQGNSITLSGNVEQLEDKTGYTIDFADYLIIPDGKEVQYTVLLDGQPVQLNNSQYEIIFADENLGTEAKIYTFSVTASATSATGSSEVEYTVTLSLTDTRVFTVVNGNFEDGLNGWTVTSGDGAYINKALTYWESDANFKDQNGQTVQYFHQEGEAFLSTDEPKSVTIRSTDFYVRANSYISFKFGSANNENCYIVIRDSVTGEELVRIYNNPAHGGYFSDPTLAQILLRRFVDMSSFADRKVYVEIVDNADSDFGFIGFDDLRVNMTGEEAQTLISQDQLWASTYRQDVLDSSEAMGSKTKEIITAVRNYYRELALPDNSTAAISETTEQI